MKLFALVLALLPALSAQEKPVDPDSAKYSALLEKYVADGRVDYAGLRKDRAALDAYLKAASEARGEHGLAFWLNVYNASVLRDLVDSGEKLPAKVTDLAGFFDAKKHTVNGESRTLNQIEGFVREHWKDPRVHFALNCGARSCPPLPARAFVEEKLDAKLEELTRAFLDGPGIVLDPKAKEVRVTKLLDWYRDDFTAGSGTLESFLRKHVTDGRKLDALGGANSWKLAFQDYDWTPNSAR
ncbi:MAG: DUF547 domain-containing protein [Planctomycetes bacterium]|nr:DUF547 domain-containing protein [Planctomycetota bacterium]